MHHPRSSAIALLGALATAACSSTYHPEYHPVTVSNFSQNIAYPTTVNGDGSVARAPVVVVPTRESGTLVVPSPQPEGPPPDFFR